MEKNKILLSSNVTFIYKYLIPIIFFLIFIVLLISIFINYLNIELPVRILLFLFSFIFCLFMIPLINIQFIYYDDNCTTIKGMKQTTKVQNGNIVQVKRFMLYFYKLTYKEKGIIKKVIFLPHIMGALKRFWGKPNSIKKYELSIINFLQKSQNNLI